jgi:hypothetical protein
MTLCIGLTVEVRKGVWSTESSDRNGDQNVRWYIKMDSAYNAPKTSSNHQALIKESVSSKREWTSTDYVSYLRIQYSS